MIVLSEKKQALIAGYFQKKSQKFREKFKTMAGLKRKATQSMLKYLTAEVAGKRKVFTSKIPCPDFL